MTDRTFHLNDLENDHEGLAVPSCPECGTRIILSVVGDCPVCNTTYSVTVEFDTQ